MSSNNERHDPLRALKNIRTELKGSHERLHYQIVCVYLQAQLIAANAFHIIRFRAEPFWKGVEFPNCILRAAMRFAWDAAQTNTGDYKAAVFASAALQYYFDDGVSADEVYGLLKEAGGIDPLHKGQPPHSKASAPAESSSPKGSIMTSSPGTGSPGANNSRPTQAKPMAGSGKAQDVLRSGPRHFSRAWCEERLCLEIDRAKLARVLNVAEGRKGKISFVAEGPDDSGFLIFRVVAVSIGRSSSVG